MQRIQSLICTALALMLFTSSDAQDIYLDASTNGMTIMTDGATFYDSGRYEDRYSNFEDHTTNVCSISGAPLVIEFFEFYLEENKDLLYISYGEGTDIRPVPGSPFSGESLKKQVITSSESCLTFRVLTDFNVMRSGWDAEISTMDPIVEAKN